MTGDLTCGSCGFVARSGAGLAAHSRQKHPPEPECWSNVEAAQALLDELRRCGRLERVDVADEQALLSMAAQVDADPGNASMWRQYREHIQAMRADDDGSDDVGAVLEALRSATPMGNPQTS